MASTDTSGFYYSNNKNGHPNFYDGFTLRPMPITSESLTFAPNFITPEVMNPTRSQMRGVAVGGEVNGDWSSYYYPDAPFIKHSMESLFGNRLGRAALDGEPAPDANSLRIGNEDIRLFYEKEFPLEGGDYFYRLSDVSMSSMTLEVAANELPTISFSGTAGKLMRGVPGKAWDPFRPIPYVVRTSTYSAPPARGDRSYINVLIDGVTQPQWCFTSLTVNIANNNASRFCIGTYGAAGTRLGQFEITLNATIYMVGSADVVFKRMDADEPIRIFLTLLSEGTNPTMDWWDFPACVIESADVLLSGPGEDVLLETTLRATTAPSGPLRIGFNR